ncbi:lectin OAA family protein [Sphingomonas sp. PAMC 26617]|uniref:lectin OAA family protein n=1 Tax=Sphingomonas sp. PAMC 26617 TaxID=1112216 RepID=UPI000289FEC7|nr:hypothetical protein [Sphingomonas sp. PAMC 26617]
MTVYSIQNQWGGPSAPWHDGGIVNIGNRGNQLPVALHIRSGDGGLSFSGTMAYKGEGPIELRAKHVTENCYHAENQWGGKDAPWHDAGLFLLGARDGQNAVEFDLSGPDGTTLEGTMKYAGEGPIGVKARETAGLAFDATNQWGGVDAPWHQGGQWVIGCRPEQAVTALEISSHDNGLTLFGTMNYAGEGPIGFKATRTMANTYSVVNQWGGSDAPWHPGGTWVLGCRGKQGIAALSAKGDAHGLHGTMLYTGEGSIGLKLAPSVVKVLQPA